MLDFYSTAASNSNDNNIFEYDYLTLKMKYN